MTIHIPEVMQQKVFEARIRLLLRQWPVVWGGNLGVQFICGIVLWPYFSHFTIVLWCGGNYLLFALRLFMRQRFPSQVALGHRAVQRWAYSYAASAALGGLIWSSGVWLFVDESHPQLSVFLLVVLGGITAGALPALSSYSLAFIVFASSLILPMSLRLWMLDWDYANWLSLLALVFLAVVIFFSRILERTITTSITADFRNQLLLDEVTLARNSAEQANRAKSNFLASVSHDLRQPLHAMGLFMESLNKHLHEPQQKSLYENISTAHDSLKDMFDALLEISRLETGSVKPIITHFQLHPILTDLVDNFSQQAKQKGLSLKLQETQTVVHTDSVLLSGILSNLLSNAIKYTDKGKVWIETVQSDGMIKLSVHDTGCGISTNNMELIFSEYHQLDNPERDKSKGLGLGLSVVKRTAELLGYDLQLESTEGIGSVFTLSIPLGEVEQVKVAIKAKPQRTLKGLHILVIDDDAAVREATLSLLTDWGCEVTCSDSAASALLELGTSSPPNLLICDYRLRDQLTGIDAVTAIRNAIDPELPALIISGDTCPELRSKIAELGYYMLSKPIKPAQLQHVIAELLD